MEVAGCSCGDCSCTNASSLDTLGYCTFTTHSLVFKSVKECCSCNPNRYLAGLLLSDPIPQVTGCMHLWCKPVLFIYPWQHTAERKLLEQGVGLSHAQGVRLGRWQVVEGSMECAARPVLWRATQCAEHARCVKSSDDKHVCKCTVQSQLAWPPWCKGGSVSSYSMVHHQWGLSFDK